MDTVSLQALHQLVSLVHDGVSIFSQSEQLQSTPVEDESKKDVHPNSFCVEDDPVAKVIWTLEPLQLQNVLLGMVAFKNVLDKYLGVNFEGQKL
ncbi:hypothetical protein MKX03_004757 [Papaver bracteatum]|nr:hypothetical protein MKX03_004757 [Papaver bracteatum]